ncbi:MULTISPECIES: glycerol kinase GlpK [unclassified Clostridium]|uniref:glycerol kinase GlpK n=1 Tax=unclassified Clostridium TaxID=2614128 RepID=UPI0025BBAEF1|nr:MULTISPECIES: glycerol kinase GlpK [unclassified Clostridium]
MEKYIVALDQGTTSSRAIIFDKEQNILEIAQKEITPMYPQKGWVEQDPMEIYASQYGVLTEVLAKTGLLAENIAAIGITNQRETTILWDKETGRPVYNAIGWQCRRTAEICDKLKADGWESYIRENTGLVVDAYFSATKIKWILDNVEGVREKAEKGEILFGTVDTWLVWKLTNGKVHVTDYTNASRTMLFNIRTLKWDEKILKALNIPESMLPEVKNSSEIYGRTNLGGKGGTRVPISGIAGDQQAALFGQACFEKGSAKNTYGTGCFLLMNTGDEIIQSKNGLITTIAIGIDNKVHYALEGSVFVGGAVIQWLRDELRIVNDSNDTEYFAQKVKDNGGVYIVPAFTGLGAPYWDMYARGAIFGLTRGANRNHIIRAALESIAYQTKDVIDAMIEDTGLELEELKVDGGASSNGFLLQFQSDILGKIVRRPLIRETTALGAAYLAGLAVGFWKDKEEIMDKWNIDNEYTPNLDEETRQKLYKSWRKAVIRAQEWEEHDA